MAERNVRARVEIPVKEFPATLKNLSLTGCFLDTENKVALGETVSFRVVLEGREIQLHGKVVRVEPGGLGISFSELSNDERRELAVLIAEGRDT